MHFISKVNDLDGLAPYKLPGAEISWFARTPLSVSHLVARSEAPGYFTYISSPVVESHSLFSLDFKGTRFLHDLSYSLRGCRLARGLESLVFFQKI